LLIIVAVGSIEEWMVRDFLWRLVSYLSSSELLAFVYSALSLRE
jgi:hypothetical protein